MYHGGGGCNSRTAIFARPRSAYEAGFQKRKEASRVFNALGTLALILFLTVLLTTIIPKNMLWFPASERNIKVSTETWESLKDLSGAKSPGDTKGTEEPGERNRRRVPNGAGMDLALNGDTRVDSRKPRRRGYLSETEGNES